MSKSTTYVYPDEDTDQYADKCYCGDDECNGSCASSDLDEDETKQDWEDDKWDAHRDTELRIGHFKRDD